MLITIVMKPYMCLLQGGDTVLHKAVQNGQQDMLRLLISSGMSPDTEGLVSCYIATWYVDTQYNNDDVIIIVMDVLYFSVVSNVLLCHLL